MVTSQNQNNDQVNQTSEFLGTDIVINRANLIRDIENGTDTHEYYKMLSAILEQTGDNLEALKAEMIGLLKYEIQQELNLADEAVITYTTPIELKIDELLVALKDNNEDTFNEKLEEIRILIEKSKTDEYINDIFERDGTSQKISTMYFLADENYEYRTEIDLIREQILPTQINEKLTEIISNQQTTLVAKYDLINSILKNNPIKIPGLEGLGSLDDLQFILLEYHSIGCEKLGGAEDFLQNMLSKGESILESVTSSRILEALAPFQAYKRASETLDIPKRQLRGIGKLTVAQVRLIVEDDELMNYYKTKMPSAYSALTKIKEKLLQDDGPVEALKNHFLLVANEDRSLTQELKREMYSFAAYIEEERLDTIITGYYCDEVSGGHDHLKAQNFAVLWSYIKKANKSGVIAPFKRMGSIISGQASSANNRLYMPGDAIPDSLINNIERELQKYTDPDVNKPHAERKPTTYELVEMSDSERLRYEAEYKGTVRSLSRDLAQIERQISTDIEALRSNPSLDLDDIKKRYNITGNQNPAQILDIVRGRADQLEIRKLKLEKGLQSHARKVTDTLVSNNKRPLRGVENSFDRFTYDRAKSLSSKGLTALGPLAAMGLAFSQGSTVKQTAIIGGETIGTMIPVIGTCLMARQVITGRDLAGNKIEGNDYALTCGFLAISLARDIASIFTGGAAAVAFAGFMSGANTIKSAPMLTRMAYHTTKLFTKAGRISSVANSTGNIARRAENIKSFGKTFKNSFNAIGGLKNTFRPKNSVLKAINNKFLKVVASPAVVATRICMAPIKALFSTIRGTFAGMAFLQQKSLNGLSRVYRGVMSGTIRGLSNKNITEAAKIISNVTKSESKIGQLARLKQAALINNNKEGVKNISKLIVAETTAHKAAITGAKGGVREVLDVYRKGSNSPLLHLLSKGMRQRELLNKAEAYLSYAVLGSAGISLGGGLVSGWLGDDIVEDVPRGIVQTASNLQSVASGAVDAAIYASSAVQGHAVARENITRTFNRRTKDLAKIAEHRRAWRSMSDRNLASLYITEYSGNSRSAKKIRKAFLNYIKRKGLTHRKLVEIYNSNLDRRINSNQA